MHVWNPLVDAPENRKYVPYFVGLKLEGHVQIGEANLYDCIRTSSSKNFHANFVFFWSTPVSVANYRNDRNARYDFDVVSKRCDTKTTRTLIEVWRKDYCISRKGAPVQTRLIYVLIKGTFFRNSFAVHFKIHSARQSVFSLLLILFCTSILEYVSQLAQKRKTLRSFELNNAQREIIKYIQYIKHVIYSQTSLHNALYELKLVNPHEPNI